MAVVTVLVLAVAAGGAAYWWLRGTKIDGLVYRAVPADARWNKSWVNGYREIWSLKATNGFTQGRFASVTYAEGKLIRATPDEEFVDVEVYSLTSKTPTLLFKDRFEGGDGSYEANVWQGWLIEKGELVNLESQKRQDAPWDDDAKVSIVGGYAIACEKAQCSMWSSSKERVWTKTLSFLRPDEVDDVTFDHPIGPYVSAHTGFRAQAVQSLIVDLRDGSSKSIKQEGAGVYPRPLADGWLLYDPYKSLEGPATVTLLKADGSVQETFEEGIPQDFKNYPWSPGYWTLDQARAWFKSGDTSWAPIPSPSMSAIRNAVISSSAGRKSMCPHTVRSSMGTHASAAWGIRLRVWSTRVGGILESSRTGQVMTTLCVLLTCRMGTVPIPSRRGSMRTIASQWVTCSSPTKATVS